MVFTDHCDLLPKGLRGIKILAHTAVSVHPPCYSDLLLTVEHLCVLTAGTPLHMILVVTCHLTTSKETAPLHAQNTCDLLHAVTW